MDGVTIGTGNVSLIYIYFNRKLKNLDTQTQWYNGQHKQQLMHRLLHVLAAQVDHAVYGGDE